MQQPASELPERQWLGQPRGLTILALTETWNQFSFYGMRTLLVYYMTRQLLLSQQDASYVYGLYTAFVYFTPIVGGIVSDRWLGRRNSILAGGTIMALGHFMMVFEGSFYMALATIALGNGLFLPSVPSQIDSLYRPDDPRRTSAYNVYYMGVNLGAMMAPFVCGTIGEIYGWHYGFAVAGIGMLVGLMIYIFGSRYLPREPAGLVASVHASADQDAMTTSTTARRFALLGGIAAVVVLFRAGYEQIGNTVALWADTGVDRAVNAQWSIPMTWFQSLNPLVVLFFTPLVLAYWRWQARNGREPSSIVKMAIGAAVVALAYLMLAMVSGWAGANDLRAHWVWLAAFLILLTSGELFILPIGLGLFSRLAPHGYAATTVAAWFLAAFFGNLLAGALGALWSDLSDADFFLLMAAVTGSSAAALLLFVRVTRRADSPKCRPQG